MGFKKEYKSCDKENDCPDLSKCELQDIGNVDTANLQDGDVLCFVNGEWTNIPKNASKVAYKETIDEDPSDGFKDIIFYRVDSNGPVIGSEFSVRVADSTEIPDNVVTYVFSPLPNGGVAAEAFDVNGVSLGVQNIGSDDQTASEVPALDEDGQETTVQACLDNIKSRVKVLEETNPITINNNESTGVTEYLWNGVSFGSHLDNVNIYSAQVNPNGTWSLFENQESIFTTPLVSVTESENGSIENILVGDVIVGSFNDNDTVSSAHPDYTFTENIDGDLVVARNGVVLATIEDADTISTPHPAITFAPNSNNGTDVFIDGVVSYTIPDNDTVSSPAPVITGVNNEDGTTSFFSDGALIVTTTPHEVDTNTQFIIDLSAPVSTTTNPDGSKTICYPVVNAVTGESSGLDDKCITLPPDNDTDTCTVATLVENDVCGQQLTLQKTNAISGTPIGAPVQFDFFNQDAFAKESGNLTFLNLDLPANTTLTEIGRVTAQKAGVFDISFSYNTGGTPFAVTSNGSYFNMLMIGPAGTVQGNIGNENLSVFPGTPNDGVRNANGNISFQQYLNAGQSVIAYVIQDSMTKFAGDLNSRADLVWTRSGPFDS